MSDDGVLGNLINNFSSPEEAYNLHLAVPLGSTPVGVDYNSFASTADSSAGAQDDYSVAAHVGNFETGVGLVSDASHSAPSVDVFSSLLGSEPLDLTHLDLSHTDSFHL